MTDYKPTLLFILALLFITIPLSAAPPERSNELDYQFRLNASADLGNLEPMLNITTRIEEGDLQYKALMLGGYYRLHKNVKAGVFYTLQAGARHDDDWIGTPVHWWWDSTTDRLEHLISLDLSPRFLVPALPGENWVFMLKNRWTWNSYNNHQTLLVRPGLTYTYMTDREPVWSSGVQYGLYFPLNFSDVLLYEQNPYINFIYHVSPAVKVELFAEYTMKTWSTSEDVKDAGDPDYTVTDKVFVLGTGVLLRF